MPLYDQVELLCQAILTQGTGEAEKVIDQTRAEADSQVAAAEARRRETVRRARAETQAQARLEAQSRIDRAALESKRRLAEAREAMLAEIFQQGLQRLLILRGTPEYADWLRRKMIEAIKELASDHILIKPHPEEAGWLSPDLVAQVGQEVACQLDLVPDPEVSCGGFLAVRADGRMRYDQTFQGISNRRRDEVRMALARILWHT